MPVPQTYLMVPPPGESRDHFGQALNAWAIIAKLTRINPSIRASEPTSVGHSVLTGNSDPGITCLWLTSNAGLRKISSMRLGAVPEFTQQSPDGTEICKGWRAIFEKVIKMRAASRAQIERAFGISLVLAPENRLCRRCLIKGVRRQNNGGVLNACDFHERLLRSVKR